MYYGDRLDLDSEILKGLRSEIEVSLCAALMLADKEGKEIEVGIKVKVKTETVRTYNEGKVSREWEEPRISWNVTRKKKEDKIDFKGSARAGWELRFDEDGRPYVVEINKQTTLFDIVKGPFKSDEPEVTEDAEEATLDDDRSGVGDGSECERGEPDFAEGPEEDSESGETDPEE
jgi:hypothetical protein